MNFEVIRTIILALGWPLLLMGSFLFTRQALGFYKKTNKSALGKLVLLQSVGMLLSMFALGITATFFMFDNISRGVTVVLPVFGVWLVAMTIVYYISQGWNAEATRIDMLSQKAIRSDKILSMLGQAVIFFDAKGAVTYLNPNVNLLLDALSKELVNENIDTVLQITLGKSGPVEEGVITKTVLQLQKPFSADLYKKTLFLTDKSGRQFPVSLIVTPVSFVGSLEGGVAIFRDITAEEKLRLEAMKAQRRLETLRAQKKQIKDLRALDRLKDNFLNNTTHELKTPLIPIKSQTQLLLAEDYGTLNAGQKKAVQMILRNETHLENLVGDVVNITKIRSGKLNVFLEDSDPTEIITNAVQDMEELAKAKGLVLTLQPIPEIPTSSLDRKLTTQVINNVLSNALKFTPKGGEVIVELSSRSKPGSDGKKTPREIEISVKDTGIGMSKETLEKLFTPFFQADSDAARKYGGTGLGLSICKGIMETQGGTIWAESDGEGKGTTVRFTLPIQN